MGSDIVLVYPRTGFDIKTVSLEIPMAVLGAATFVDRDGYKVKIIDQRMDPEWDKHLRSELKNGTLLVGLSSITGDQIHFSLDAAKIVREENPDLPIVWGGIHPTIMPIQTVESEYCDIVVKNEGEQPLLELANAFDKGQPEKVKEIRGVTAKVDGKIYNNPEAANLNVEELPFLPYHLLDMKEYIKAFGGTVSFLSSRGCPFQCTYCSNPFLSQRRWRMMSPKRTMEELEFIRSKWDFNKVKFNDEHFFVDKNRVYGIAEGINDAYEWEAQTRLDTVAYIDYEKLSKTGLYQIQPGLESGNPRILKMIKKEVTVENIIRYNKMLADTGIVCTYNFMTGFPTETIDEIKETIRMSLKLLDDNPNSEIAAFYIFTPYPGTEAYDLALENGFRPPTTLEGWSRFSRQQLLTPWIQDKKELMENLAVTSKFVDQRRIARLFAKTRLPSFIPKLMGKLYRHRWDRENFKMTWDLKFVEWFINKQVNIFTN